ncbi:ig domain protein group 2 domain protein [Clostridium sp. CAG:75]|nr:ig domain protein group 2 domain protein [Clostridium sp. CAG:75]
MEMKQQFFKHTSVNRTFFIMVLIAALLTGLFAPAMVRHSGAASPFIILSSYRSSLKIGQEMVLSAVTSDLSYPSFTSSASSIASVNVYGVITAKKAGTCKIKVKSGKSETYCQIQVVPTTISLNKTALSLEKQQTFQLTARTSNRSVPTYRSNKKSVALVSSTGLITALKPGSATITIKADQTEQHCQVTVVKPTITLSQTAASLFRGQNISLRASVSNKTVPTWSSSARSIAVVSDSGVVTAKKHGTATIAVKADGVTRTCKITVKSPTIKLSASKLTIKKGKRKTLTAKVSSGNAPTYSSSNSSVASVTKKGVISARKKGTATIKVKEDGTTVSCKITVK